MGMINTLLAPPTFASHEHVLHTYLPTAAVLKRLSYIDLLDPTKWLSLEKMFLYIHISEYDPEGLRDELRMAFRKEAHILVLCPKGHRLTIPLGKLVRESTRADFATYSDLPADIGDCVCKFIESQPLLRMWRGSCSCCASQNAA